MGLFAVTITNEDTTLRALEGHTGRMTDLRAFWVHVFAPRYFAMVQDLFATGGRARSGSGRFKGGAWAPLSPKYRAWKSRFYPGRPILERTGALRESVRWTGNGLGPQGIFEATPRSVTVGTSVPYAKFHQRGTGRMHARDFLPQPDVETFRPLLALWITKGTVQ